ncbi:MAG: glycosyltransferase [Proteobacteria bacterium]|nr:glycosyltransferase [Pseudomonadota bacterium]
MQLKGHVDKVEQTHIIGWAFDADDMSRRVELELYDGNELVFRFTADKLRHDFLNRGQGDGCYGFWVNLPRDLFCQSVHRLSVRFAQTGQDIGNSPQNYFSGTSEADESFSRWLLARIDSIGAAAGRQEDLTPLLALCTNALSKALEAQARLEDSHGATATTALALSELPERLRAVAERAARDFTPFHLPVVRQPVISIIVQASPSLRDTLGLLKSLVEPARACAAEVICIDATGSAELTVVPLFARGGIRLVKTGTTGTMLDAYRLGYSMARGGYLMFLAGASALPRRTLDLLRETLVGCDHQAIVAPRLIGPDQRIVESGTRISIASGRVQLGRFDQAEAALHRLRRASDDVSAQAFMVHRALFERVGGFEGAEDYGALGVTDLAFRVRAAGGQVISQGAAGLALVAEMPLAPTPKGARLAFTKRWQAELERLSHQPQLVTRRRALVIDERLPQPEQDAASNAVLSHAESLVRLGYHVEMIGLDDNGEEAASIQRLNAHGIEAHGRIDDVSAYIAARQGQFDLVYLHRISIARKFIDLCKSAQPNAQVIYSVADLHFLRMGRQAELDNDDALREQARAVERDEKRCLEVADQIITHSTLEGDWIEKYLNASKPVHRVLWSYRIAPAPTPLAQRHGIAFVGNFRHRPNGDAVRHFAREIWSPIRQAVPGQPLDIAGAHIEAAGFEDLGDGVKLRGFVQDIDAYLATKRLTVAPLRFGAGVKGKVLQSLAQGVPCVMTPIAAEGIGLTQEIIEMLVANDDAMFRERVINLMKDDALWEEASRLIIQWARARLAPEAIDQAMSSVSPTNP